MWRGCRKVTRKFHLKQKRNLNNNLWKGIAMEKSCGFDFPFVRGVCLGAGTKRGDYASRLAYESLNRVLGSFNFNTVVLPVAGWQESINSTAISFADDVTPDEWEIEYMVDYLQKRGYRVILKPIIKISDGSPCSAINFPAEESGSERRWKQWFESYTCFVVNIAYIARETCCSILSVGSGLTQAEKQDSEWRELIGSVRKIFDGYLTYQSEKGSEIDVSWWDALDMISSCVNCADEISTHIKKIGYTAEKYKKPFIIHRSAFTGNDGENEEFNHQNREEFFRSMEDITDDTTWFCGYGIGNAFA